MRITLTVDGPRAGPLGPNAIRGFGAEGGTIGRSPEADWALPDPNHFLSQFHARIAWQDGAFWLEDTSSNGTFVNGAATALGRGARHRLAEGDRLALGEYALRVALEAATQGRDTAAQAEPLPPLPMMEQAQPSPSLPAWPEAPPPPLPPMLTPAAPAPAPQTGAAAPGLDAELAALLASFGAAPAAQAPVAPQPTAPGFAPMPLAPSPKPLAAPMPLAPPPFALPPPPPLAPRAAAPLAPAIAQPATAPSTPAQPAPLPLPPMPAAALDTPAALPPLPQPMRLPLPAGAPPTATMTTAPALPASAMPAALPMPAATAMPMPLPRMPHAAASQAAPAMPSELPPELLADLTDLPRPAPGASSGGAIPLPRRAARPRASAPAEAEISDLAFWRGLGIDPDTLPPESREAALEAFGRAMRAAADGLVALLGARRFAKSEFDLEQTQLAAADNNVFKFSPSGEAALRRLMENETGFTPVDHAVSRGFGDLRAHELATAAGVQAALSAMLDRIAPAAIERRFAPIRAGLFTSQKARLWELYTTLHAEIADGAESRFKDVFSRSFASAYDQRARQAARHEDR